MRAANCIGLTFRPDALAPLGEPCKAPFGALAHWHLRAPHPAGVRRATYPLAMCRHQTRLKLGNDSRQARRAERTAANVGNLGDDFRAEGVCDLLDVFSHVS